MNRMDFSCQSSIAKAPSDIKLGAFKINLGNGQRIVQIPALETNFHLYPEMSECLE